LHFISIFVLHTNITTPTELKYYVVVESNDTMPAQNFVKIGQFLSVRYAKKNSVVSLLAKKVPCNRSFSANLKFLNVESAGMLTFAHITTKILKYFVCFFFLSSEKSHEINLKY